MSYLQPTTSTPKTMADYKKVEFEVDTEKVHELDQIEFHRHSFEMLYSTVVTKAMSVTNFQNTIINMQDQVKLDKGSLYAKYLRIKALEYLILQIGVDPSNVQAAEVLIKNKNDDIAALRKQLKLPQSEHPQSKEILQEQKEKDDMM